LRLNAYRDTQRLEFFYDIGYDGNARFACGAFAKDT
jgi:hypothetical protein